MVRPLYFWFTAKAEPVLYDFCTDFLACRRAAGLPAIDVADAVSWIKDKGLGWSDAVTIKVTRAMLAALRDFGVLEGRAHKRIASQAIPPATFAFISFCMHLHGVPARDLLGHADWRLFTMNAADVEHLFFECHQMKFLEYHAAGSTISLRFPASTAEEYAHVVLGR